MSRPYIVCGLGQVGTRVADLLLRLGERVTAITTECRPDHLRAVRELGAQVLIGDARDSRLLDQAGLSEAAAVLAVTDSDLTNVEIALDARRRRPELPVIARIFDRRLARSLEDTFGVRRALATSALAAPAIAAAALDERIIGSLSLGDQAYVLRLPGEANEADSAAIPISGPEPGRSIALLVERSGDERVLARERAAAFATAPARHAWLGAGSLMWSEAPAALRHAFLVLVALAALSVGVFKFGMGLSLVDAVYFTVTTVTTTGYGDITPRESGDLLKLYASLVMLFGSAMMAVVFSFVADFVIKERFRALSQRKAVPAEGHVVVVGLGNVGYRTANALERWGIATAAVELRGEDRFTPEIELRCPLIVGDGRLAGTLSRAHVQTAAVVVAVTGDDAINLGVVLAAREMNPRVRTVARLYDAQFAAKVRSGLGIDATVSASQIAAPTFVAAALQPEVRFAFVQDDCLVALCAHGAGAQWVGRRPAELRREGVEVLLKKPAGEARFGAIRDEAPLCAGDQLLVAHRRRLAGVSQSA